MQLVADIGATNARFQLVENNQLINQPAVLPTGDFKQGSALIHAAIAELGGITAESIDAALLAIAGPASQSGQIEVTNTGLILSSQDCQAVLGCSAMLVNDFLAMAHGVPYFSELAQIGGAEPLQENKALLGPGTGLGMATLVPQHVGEANSDHQTTNWRVIASEGGHADLAPGNHLESELWTVLLAKHGHVCWETVLSGSGIQRLYQAMSEVWGDAAQTLSPAEIVDLGQSMTDPLCHQVLETFCGLLGSAAGNMALTVVARGGIYIGGGIVPRMLDFVVASPLRRRFEERGDLSEFVEAIPILVINDPEPGLVGAMHCLHAL